MRASELHPKYPERICWGCDRRCAAEDLRCGNGTIRTPHPAELFGNDWDAPQPTSEPTLGSDAVKGALAS